jgi:N-acetyl-gamma-glutamyl-phosphate reductase/acetylglutamate kinase
MLSATTGAMRLGARRAAPRAAAALVVTPASKPFASRATANIVNQARLASSTTHTNALNTNPNPPLGKKNASNDRPSRIGLIGARGYTGQALIDLLNGHPNIDIRHVSSRELVGQELKGYDKRKIIYESLSPEDVARIDKEGEVDAWSTYSYTIVRHWPTLT